MCPKTSQTNQTEQAKQTKQTKQDKIMECPFTDMRLCLRQTASAKLDLSICTNCILGRIEKHLFAIARKLYQQRHQQRHQQQQRQQQQPSPLKK